MGFLDWLNNNIARPILKAGQWLGQKVISPTLNWVKNNVPVVGQVVQAAEPLLNTIGKTWNASTSLADENKMISEGQKIKRQKMDYPTSGEWVGAVKSGIDTASKLKGF